MLLLGVLSVNQGLLGHGESCLSAHHFDGSEGADVDLPLVVFDQALREVHGALRHGNGAAGIDQFPIVVFDRRHVGDHGLLKGEVGGFLGNFRDQYVTFIDQLAETVQKLLCE